jgi:hypothetical protein
MYLLRGAPGLDDVFVGVLVVEGGEAVVEECVVVGGRTQGILLILHLDDVVHAMAFK